RRVRATARLHAHDALGAQGPAPHQELGVLFRVDVVGDHGHFERLAQAQAERLGERRLAGADGTTDADLEWTGNRHDLNNLMSSLAWRRPASSGAGGDVHMSSAVCGGAGGASGAVG